MLVASPVLFTLLPWARWGRDMEAWVGMELKQSFAEQEVP